MEHVKLELELAWPDVSLSSTRVRLCASVVASLLLASCARSFIKDPLPVRIIHPPEREPAESLGRSRGRQWRGGSSCPSLPGQPGSTHWDQQEGTRMGLRGHGLPPAEQG